MNNQSLDNLSINELLKQKDQLEDEQYKCYNYLKQCESNLKKIDNIIYLKCNHEWEYKKREFMYDKREKICKKCKLTFKLYI